MRKAMLVHWSAGGVSGRCREDCVHNFLFELATRLSPRLCWLFLYFRLIFLMSSSAPSTTIHQNVVPSEVGWQFVPQYYTFVNKQPNRLHCFYTKSSTFVHGNEGEESKPCFGQHEIHEKITSIGFQDCKVFIHSVDAQASANGGIIIQVIGEMSNRGETWRKFVQTFFLAEQPNGYFVLNDIFRFLKEESVDADDDVDESAEPEVTPAETAPAPVPEAPQPPVREPTPPPAVAAPSPAPSFPAEEAPTNDVPEPAPQPPTPAPEPQPAPAVVPPQTNGVSTVPEPEKAAPSAAPVVEKSPTPTPAPQPPAPTPAAAAAPPPPAAAAPPHPAAPRSWATLAATNPKKWGSAVAQESRGTTETPASPIPSSGTQTPAGPAPAPRGPPNSSEHPALQAAHSVNTPQCFIKGVVDQISATALSGLLTSRFGPIKDLEIVRSKACAFLEFSSVEAARRAIVTSLNRNQGGDGGVFLEADGNPMRIFIETKKERGDRPAPRPRGGAPAVNGEGRGQGGYRGRGGSGRGGRGGPPAGK